MSFDQHGLQEAKQLLATLADRRARAARWMRLGFTVQLVLWCAVTGVYFYLWRRIPSTEWLCVLSTVYGAASYLICGRSARRAWMHMIPNRWN